MKRFILFLLTISAAVLSAQVTPTGAKLSTADQAGLLYASNFGQWQVPAGNLGQYSWDNGSYCMPTVGSVYPGITINAFTVGTPVEIVDTDTPSHDEIVIPTAVTISWVGSDPVSCSISITPIYGHNHFYFTSATGGLQEAINWAGTTPYQVIVTPDWSLLGGIASTITSATGNANVTILDDRTACSVAYLWSGSAYVAQGSSCAGGGVSQIVPGTNVTISSTGPSGTGVVTINSTGGTVSGTTGYIPVFTDTTTLGDSVIDQGVKATGAVTITDGLVVNAMDSTGSKIIQLLTGATSGSPVQYIQTGTSATYVLGSGGLKFYGNGDSSNGNTVAFDQSYGQVQFNNSTKNGVPPVVVTSNTGICGTNLPDYVTFNCGLAIYGGVEITGGLYVMSPVDMYSLLNVMAPINTSSSVNTVSGMTVTYPAGTSAQNLLVCLNSSGAADVCPVSTTTWDGVDQGAWWYSSAQRAVMQNGSASCTFDNTSVIGDYAIPSSSVAGECHDNGTTVGFPLVGKVISSGTVQLYPVGEQLYTLSVMNTLGDTLSGGTGGAATRVAGNTTTTKKFLTQTGDGTISAAPAWGSLVSGDIPDNAASTTGNAATATYATTAGSSPASTLTGDTGVAGDIVTQTGTLAGIQDSGVLLSSLATTSALAGYLPLTGGTLTGSMTAPSINNTVSACQYSGATLDVQIANAFASLPSSIGVVDATCYGTTTQTEASPISLAKGQILKFSPATTVVPASATSSAVNLVDGTQLDGLHVGLSIYATTYTGNVLNYPCTIGGNSSIITGAMITNVLIDGADSSGVGLSMVGNTTTFCNWSNIYVNNLDIRGLQYPIVVTTQSGTSQWFNGNTFDNLSLYGPSNTALPVSCITLNNEALEIFGNIFTGLCEGNSAAGSYGIVLNETSTAIQDISGSNFYMNIYDTTDYLYISSTSLEDNIAGNTIFGYAEGTTNDNGNTTLFVSTPSGPNYNFGSAQLKAPLFNALNPYIILEWQGEQLVTTSGSGLSIYNLAHSGKIYFEDQTGGDAAIQALSITDSSLTTAGCVTNTAAGVLGTAACSSSSGLTVGTTTISGGTSGYIEYNNAGVLGELATTGTGSVVLASTLESYLPLTGGTLTGALTSRGIIPSLEDSYNLGVAGNSWANVSTWGVTDHGLTTAGYVTNTSDGVLGTVATIPNTGLVHSSITINGTTCTLGSTCTVTAASSSIGYATLSSGRVTVSNTAACTPSATCVYKLTNCGINSSAAIGTLSVGTVVAGTSFVINSETALAALAVDNSNVCWQIN